MRTAELNARILRLVQRRTMQGLSGAVPYVPTLEEQAQTAARVGRRIVAAAPAAARIAGPANYYLRSVLRPEEAKNARAAANAQVQRVIAEDESRAAVVRMEAEAASIRAAESARQAQLATESQLLQHNLKVQEANEAQAKRLAEEDRKEARRLERETRAAELKLEQTRAAAVAAQQVINSTPTNLSTPQLTSAIVGQQLSNTGVSMASPEAQQIISDVSKEALINTAGAGAQLKTLAPYALAAAMGLYLFLNRRKK